MLLERAKQWARLLKRDVVALWIAARDPRTPLCAKAMAAVVAAYALSPIDLIPDFIPIIGYLDDLVIVPVGIALAIRIIPPELMCEFRQEAAGRQERPQSTAAAVLIAATWLIALFVCSYGLYRYSR
jgi:uncharacterized membrane protein YkvA (DUF1232 family)